MMSASALGSPVRRSDFCLGEDRMAHTKKGTAYVGSHLSVVKDLELLEEVVLRLLSLS